MDGVSGECSSGPPFDSVSVPLTEPVLGLSSPTVISVLVCRALRQESQEVSMYVRKQLNNYRSPPVTTYLPFKFILSLVVLSFLN